MVFYPTDKCFLANSSVRLLPKLEKNFFADLARNLGFAKMTWGAKVRGSRSFIFIKNLNFLIIFLRKLLLAKLSNICLWQPPAAIKPRQFR